MQKLLLIVPENFKTYIVDRYTGEIAYLGYFLTGIGPGSATSFIEWALNSHQLKIETNSAWLEKRNNHIRIGFLFADESDGGPYFEISVDQFVNLLQNWKLLITNDIQKISIIENQGLITVKEYEESDNMPDAPEPISLSDLMEPETPCEPKYLTVNIEHIFSIARPDVHQLADLHHDYLGAYEKANIIQLKDVITGQFGEYKATVLWNGTIIKTKRFFPKHWTHEQVLESIFEAYHNFLASGESPRMQADGLYHLKSHNNAGMNIALAINKDSCIVTSYPIM